MVTIELPIWVLTMVASLYLIGEVLQFVSKHFDRISKELLVQQEAELENKKITLAKLNLEIKRIT